MTYNVGTVGLGHWARRFRECVHNSPIRITKAVGTRAFEEKRHELETYSINKDRYFRIGAGDPIPKEFFDGLDAVHIVSPNQFHMNQAKNSLENDKVTVVEKTFAVTKNDFADFADFVRRGGHDGIVTLHMHYLFKALTIQLGNMIDDLTKKYGKILSVSATFFEKSKEEDMRRSWIFGPENGGVILDWVHPISIVTHVLGAKLYQCESSRAFLTQAYNDTLNPTAAEVIFKAMGDRFTNGAPVTVRVGKGIETNFKRIRINFDGAFVDATYMSTESEITTGKRGTIEIHGNDPLLIEASGRLSYEHMIDEMVSMIFGNAPKMTVKQTSNIFEPVWMSQEKVSGLIKDKNYVDKFVRSGLLNVA